MYKKAVVRKEYTPGMTAHWSGLDSYTNGSWVDRVKGYKLTPTVAANFAYVPEGKYYYNNSYKSYMNSNFPLKGGSDGMYTMEIVYRDLKSVTGNENRSSGIWRGAGFLMAPSSYNGPHIYRIYSSGHLIEVRYRNGGGSHLGIGKGVYQSNLAANEMTSFSYSPKTIGINGVKTQWGSYDSKTKSLAGNLVLGSYSVQTDRAVSGMKVHAVRWYPFMLTEEQIAHNYECDKQWYGI